MTSGNELAVISDGVHQGRSVTRVIYGEGGFTLLDAETIPTSTASTSSTSSASTACSSDTRKLVLGWTSPGEREQPA